MGVEAQRKTPTQKKIVTEEPAPEDQRIAEMRMSMQQITFIDSIVADKDNYMSLIPLSSSIGLLTQHDGLGTFTNEMGDRRLSTTKDSTIAVSDNLGGMWTEPQPIGGIGHGQAINPFLMPDGITLYYAQKGDNSIGGYDIFVTRYDSERGTFLRPENIGMPFASESNDLFYAVDEFRELGYFVTDRRQPRGKVCIYTFIPQQPRRVYNADDYTDEKLHSLADIRRIADTWGDGQQRKQAMQRLGEARAQMVKSIPLSMPSEAASEIADMKQQAETMKAALDKARNFYATASEADRNSLKAEIIESEKQLEMLLTEIKNKEKLIPYGEE